MRELTLEDIGVDLDRVIRLLGGPEKVMRHFEPEEILQYLGEEGTMENMVRKLGREKVRQQVERILEKLSTNKAS